MLTRMAGPRMIHQRIGTRARSVRRKLLFQGFNLCLSLLLPSELCSKHPIALTCVDYPFSKLFRCVFTTTGFFDFYIIPLAKKLADCGVFGVSSAEYLRYAEQNRKEWELRGQDLVAGYIAKFNQEYDGRRSSQVGAM